MNVDWNRHRQDRDTEWFSDVWWKKNADAVLEAVLVASICLMIASFRPGPLVPMTLAGLLWLAAISYSIAAIVRGETLNSTDFNRWRQAFFFAGLAMICGMLVDPETARRFVEQARDAQHARV